MTTDEEEDTLDTLRLPSRINSTLPTLLYSTTNLPKVGHCPVPTKDDTLLPFLPQLHLLPFVSTTRPQSISGLHLVIINSASAFTIVDFVDPSSCSW